MTGAPLGALLVWLGREPLVSLVGLAGLGLTLAPVFPLMIADTPRRLTGRGATEVIGFEVAAAYLGTAALPGLTGMLARSFGLEAIGPVMLAASVGLLALHGLTLGFVRREARRGDTPSSRFAITIAPSPERGPIR
jgi:fucose permease